MCSIIGSFDKDKLCELVKLNQFRGNFSYSFTDLDFDNTYKTQVKEFGDFDCNVSKDLQGYGICHVQAPTGGSVKDYNRIHPATNQNGMLWHNGLLTSRGIKNCQKLLNSNETFDTKLLLEAITLKGFNILSEIEGLFACLLILDGKTYIFRTKHAKLFIDNNLNISSERFNGGKCINFDTVYEIDLKNKSFHVVDTFKTKRYNIIIDGEIED